MNIFDLATKAADNYDNVVLISKFLEGASDAERLAIWYLVHIWARSTISIHYSNKQLYKDNISGTVYVLSHKRIYVKDNYDNQATKYVIPIYLILISPKLLKALPEEVVNKLLEMQIHKPFMEKLNKLIEMYEKNDSGLLEVIHIAVRYLHNIWYSNSRALSGPYKKFADILTTSFGMLSNYITKCFIEEREPISSTDIIKQFEYDKTEMQLTLVEEAKFITLQYVMKPSLLAHMLKLLVQLRVLENAWSNTNINLSQMEQSVRKMLTVNVRLGKKEIVIGYDKDSGKYILTGNRIEYKRGKITQTFSQLSKFIFEPEIVEKLPSACCFALAVSSNFSNAVIASFEKLSKFITKLSNDKDLVAFCLLFKDLLERYIRIYRHVRDPGRIMLLHLVLNYLVPIIDAVLSKLPDRQYLNIIVEKYFMINPNECPFLKFHTSKLELVVELSKGWVRALLAQKLNLHFFEVTFGFLEIVREAIRKIADHVLADVNLASRVNVCHTISETTDEYVRKLQSQEKKSKTHKAKEEALQATTTSVTLNSDRVKVYYEYLRRYTETDSEISHLIEEVRLKEKEQQEQKRKLASVYLCENCYFVFASYKPVDKCPLCNESKLRKLFDTVPEKLPKVTIRGKEYYDVGYIDASCSRCGKIFRIFLTVPREKFDTCPYCGGELRYFTEKYCLDLPERAQKMCLEMYNDVAKLVEEEEK